MRVPVFTKASTLCPFSFKMQCIQEGQQVCSFFLAYLPCFFHSSFPFFFFSGKLFFVFCTLAIIHINIYQKKWKYGKLQIHYRSWSKRTGPERSDKRENKDITPDVFLLDYFCWFNIFSSNFWQWHVPIKCLFLIQYNWNRSHIHIYTLIHVNAHHISMSIYETLPAHYLEIDKVTTSAL